VLDIEHGSLLVPDAGGTLLWCRLRIYDLGMLCDRTIARTMCRDRAALHDYIFDEVQPTFIHTHGSWSFRAELAEDPRLERDYIAILVYEERWPPETWAYAATSGDYVRRDAVRGREGALAGLQADPGYDRFWG
jgi:hypothetical protein